MNSAAGIIDRVVNGRGRVPTDAIAALSDAEKMELLRQAGEIQRLLDAVVVETVATVPSIPAGSGTPGFCGLFGCATMNELLQRVLRVDGREAARVVKVAAGVHRELNFSTGEWQPALFPQLREALIDGVIGVSGFAAATGPILSAGRRITVEERMQADAQLADLARGMTAADGGDDAVGEDAAGEDDAGEDVAPPATPEDLRLFARVIMAYLDPDGAKPSAETAMRGRGVRFGREKNGLIPLHGDLLPEVAAQMQRIWDAYLNPKVDGPPLPGVQFTPSDDDDSTFGADKFEDEVTLPSGDDGGMIDTRTRPQKQHDALAAALGIAARHDDVPRLGGAAPTLTVSVTAEDYATGRGWAHVDGIDTPVPVSTAAHTACGGTVQRVLFDPDGRIVGIGVTDRIFTVYQRRAITLRDKECLIPGCHVPASWCEIHHVDEHARGGPTHTDNGVALCWHHHRTLDTSGWEIRMQNGVPEVRGPAWWDPARRWRTPRPLLPTTLTG